LFPPAARVAGASHAGLIAERNGAPVGGTEGNARLTAATAAVLVVLLAGEGATIPFIRQMLTPHVLIGLLLLPPVLLKLASTGWRFAQYYRGRPDYVAKGPPQPFLRLLVAPLVVVSTVTLFGTGIALVLMHPRGGLVLGLHKASFILWFGSMTVHVLAHAPTVLRWLAGFLPRMVPGRSLRGAVVAAALVLGITVALAGLPAAHAWSHWAAERHFEH
jgi:hypothetical protein